MRFKEIEYQCILQRRHVFNRILEFPEDFSTSHHTQQ